MTPQLVAYLATAALLPLALWLPGVLLFVLVHPPGRRTLTELAAYAWIDATLLLLGLFLLQDVVLERLCGVRTGRDFALLAWAGTSIVLALGVVRRGRVRELGALLRQAGGLALAHVAVVVWLAALAGADLRAPLRDLTWGHVAHEKTFGTYHTHDNYFQFVNGRALANREPFERYYADGALVYPVTSREMLPGALYAELRWLVRAVARRWEDSFGLYLLFGIAYNATIVFALDALRRRLALRLPLWGIVLLVASTSSFLVHGYFTWFKLAGAAFFLSGVVAALEARGPAGWAWTGLLWGLAGNMHPGNNLAVPFFLAGFAVATRDGARAARLTAWTGATFALTLLPWQLVKALWFPPEFVMIADHYLNGLRGDTLAATAATFVTTTPVAEQLQHRARSLVVALRLREVAELAWPWLSATWTEWGVRVAQYRFQYAAIMLYPVAALALLARLRSDARAGTPPAARLAALSLVTLVVLIALHFSVMFADVTAHLPLGPLVLVYVVLAAVCFADDVARRVLVGLCVVEGTITVLLLALHQGQHFVPWERWRYAERWLW